MWRMIHNIKYIKYYFILYCGRLQYIQNHEPSIRHHHHHMCYVCRNFFFLQHSQYTRARLYFKTLLPYNTCTRLTSCWSWPILKYLKYINFNHILYDIIPAEKKIKPITMLVNFFKVKTNVVVSNSITAGYESVRLNPHIS